MASIPPAPAGASRWTTRDLPLPAKLAVSLFLISVGVGYLSALVQMHFQHANKVPSNKAGFMPTVRDVVAHFSGKPLPWEKDAAEAEAANGPPAAAVVGPAAANMPAPPVGGSGKLYARVASILKARCVRCHAEEPEEKSAGRNYPFASYEDYEAYLAVENPGEKSHFVALITADEGKPFNNSGQMVQAFTDRSGKGYTPEMKPERLGERDALVLWATADAAVRKKAFDEDKFELPADWVQKPLTAAFRWLDDGGSPPPPVVVALPKAKKETIGKGDQIKADKLAQSTHVHLLGFSMLYGLTGLVFAFSSLPLWLRVLGAPLPLLAQLADIACWWLARLDGVGPYFAMAIMATGGVVGMSLAGQILLGLWTMYDRTGKIVVLVVGLIGMGAIGWTGLVVERELIKPRQEKIDADKAKAAEAERKATEAAEAAKNPLKKVEPQAVEPNRPEPKKTEPKKDESKPAADAEQQKKIDELIQQVQGLTEQLDRSEKARLALEKQNKIALEAARQENAKKIAEAEAALRDAVAQQQQAELVIAKLRRELEASRTASAPPSQKIPNLPD